MEEDIKFFEKHYPFTGCYSQCSKTFDQVLDIYKKTGSFSCGKCTYFIDAFNEEVNKNKEE